MSHPKPLVPFFGQQLPPHFLLNFCGFLLLALLCPCLLFIRSRFALTMASPAVKKAITEAALQYSKPEGKVFQYGTAGVSRAARSMPHEALLTDIFALDSFA